LCKYLEAVGRTDIAVGIGWQQDTWAGYLYPWAENYNLSSYPGTQGGREGREEGGGRGRGGEEEQVRKKGKEEEKKRQIQF
jgi:hypothetical protein